MANLADIVATIKERLEATFQKEQEAESRAEALGELSREIGGKLEHGLSALAQHGAYRGKPFCSFSTKTTRYNLNVQGIQRFVQLRTFEIVLGNDQFILEPKIREDALGLEYSVDDRKGLKIIGELRPRRIALMIAASSRKLDPADVLDLAQMLLNGRT